MSAHLPECPFARPCNDEDPESTHFIGSGRPPCRDCGAPCYCHALRACEVRVRADYERDVAAVEVEMMRLISRAIADGHRGNGSAEDDICCQVCQEIECDPDCAVAEARAREAAAEERGWDAAIKAALEYGLGDQEQSAIAALRKDTGREVGG